MIPVPFDHEEDAIAKSIEMRKRAMEHLANDGVIVIFRLVRCHPTRWDLLSNVNGIRLLQK